MNLSIVILHTQIVHNTSYEINVISTILNNQYDSLKTINRKQKIKNFGILIVK